MALLVLWRHRANIGRLMKGAEPKVGAKGGGGGGTVVGGG
jgi:glycerol-3-phosphate acyltransferase PlsY